MKVLVIDRNPLEGLAYQHLFKTQLAELFPHLSYVGQGFTAEEGIALLVQHQPEIVFVDVILPGAKRSLEFILQLREASPKSSIVISTNVEDFRLLHGALRVGVHHYYLKPIRISSLKNILLSIESTLGLLKERGDIPQSSEEYGDIIGRFLTASEGEIENIQQEVWSLWKEKDSFSMETARLWAIVFASEIYFEPGIKLNQQALLSSTYNHFVRQISEHATFPQLEQDLSVFLHKSARIIQNQRKSTGMQDVEAAINLLEHYVKLEEDFTLESIAREIYISPYYLSRLFRQVHAKNFSDFVIDTRMEYAKKLLGETDDNILTIATRCGYGEPNSFRRVFKTRIGLSPSQYRKAMPEENG